jgi:two-component system response regulator TctD
MRVLLVEDDPKLNESLTKILKQSGYVIDGIRDGIQANHVLCTQQYDAAILDLNLPGMDGLEVLRRLRHRGSQIPVLILTVRGELNDRVAGLNLGADDYLSKPFQLAELEARLKALIRRAQGRGNPLIRIGALEYEGIGRSFRLHDRQLVLRPKEHAVLEVLTLRAGKAVSKELLYQKIFGFDATTNQEVVEIYIHRLRKQFEGSGVRIVTLRGLGYVLEAAS